MAIPITTHQHEQTLYGDPDHWTHVMEGLFEPAIRAAGYEPVRPISKGSTMIHADIVKRLEECDLVLCDLSGLNANVFFELGVRTSLDKPMALVKDEHLRIPFDLSVLNAHFYKSSLNLWDIGAEIEALAQHLRDSSAACGGTNPLWRQFGLTIRAAETDPDETPTDAKLDLLLSRLPVLERENEALREQLSRVSSAIGPVSLSTFVPPDDSPKAVARFIERNPDIHPASPESKIQAIKATRERWHEEFGVVLGLKEAKEGVEYWQIIGDL